MWELSNLLRMSFSTVNEIKTFSTSISRCYKNSLVSLKGAKDNSLNHQSTVADHIECQKREIQKELHKPDGFISITEFKQRRRDLASRIINFYRNSTNLSQQVSNVHRHLLIVPASERQYMVGKIPYFYRQATDFRYLTGHLVPDAALVLDIEHDNAKADVFQLQSTLFVQDSNPREERWEGQRISPEAAKIHYGVDTAYNLSNLKSCLENYVQDKNSCNNESKNIAVWYDFNNPTNRNIHEVMLNMKKLLDENFKNRAVIQSPRYCMDEARIIKSPAEISLMKRSCQIAAGAIRDTVSNVHDLNSELQMASFVEHQCKMKGASYMAYPSVVASGDNCNVIHYTQLSNHKFTKANRNDENMLMDAGCEYGGYNSDITRTWPLSGIFDDYPRRLVYEAVLDVQQTLIRALQQNDMEAAESKTWTVDSLYYEMKRLFLPHLVNLGLIDEKANEHTINLAISEACPHHVSHYLGMDVHDTPSIPKSVPLLPGMIITIEPALYFPKYRELRHLNVCKELKGIGVRIEDDILITENNITDKHGKCVKQLGCEILSSKCPRTIEELESLMSSKDICETT